ncbi:MAG: hypothetical protein DDT32_01886 [Syntrophomonadaceae bacterium]|nr:hypothetical protein [Bacillota bacterium]
MMKESTLMRTLIEEDSEHLVRLLAAIDKYTKKDPEVIVESRGCILRRYDSVEGLGVLEEQMVALKNRVAQSMDKRISTGG